MAVVDPHGYLQDMDWKLRSKVNRLGRLLYSQTGMDLRIRDGRRTCDRQNAIYAQGRSAPGPVVTHAPGCRSWHVTGLAVDADPVRREAYRAALAAGESEDRAYQSAVDRPHGNCGAYGVAGAIWESLGGVWGGRFTSFGPCGDMGHFEYHPGKVIEDVCPSPNACSQVEMAISTVSPWLYVTLAVGAVAWVGATAVAQAQFSRAVGAR